MHLTALAFSEAEAFCLLVDCDSLDAGPRIRIVPGAVRSTVSGYDDLLLHLWHMSCTQ